MDNIHIWKKICSSCKKNFGYKVTLAGKVIFECSSMEDRELPNEFEFDVESHGYCPKCHAKLIKKIQLKKAWGGL